VKLILTQEVGGLGGPGDVVEVRDGYGRNYLVPRGFAIAWTKGGEKQVATIKRARNARQVRDLDHAKEIRGQVETLTVRMRARAGDGGRLFGSITAVRRWPRPGPAAHPDAGTHQVARPAQRRRRAAPRGVRDDLRRRRRRQGRQVSTPGAAPRSAPPRTRCGPRRRSAGAARLRPGAMPHRGVRGARPGGWQDGRPDGVARRCPARPNPVHAQVAMSTNRL